jgi:hypothetical protein
MSVIESTEPLTLTWQPHSPRPAADLVRAAAEIHLKSNDVEELRWLCSHPEAPEDFLLKMCDLRQFIDELGHRAGPRSLLLKMAEEVRYPESVLTLGTILYTDARESDGDFAEFLGRHAENEWLLGTLVRSDASSAAKEAALVAVIERHPRADQLLDVRRVRREEMRAATATDEAEIRQLFALDEPQVWRALAANPATPSELLERLAEMNRTSHAREIRVRARANLDARRRAT